MPTGHLARLSLAGAVALAAVLTGCSSAPLAAPAPDRARPTVAPLGIPADAQRVEVRWISDGDTVGVRAEGRGVLAAGADTTVRLLLIDTPESKHRDLPVQCFAQRATRATERLLPEGSDAWVQADRELLDQYDRALLYVWNTDGTFVNERLVRRGFARVEWYRPNDRHLDRIRAAERAAREAGRGLWSHC